jgi:N-acetylmuramoyl-L-alanine amidase
MRYLVLVFLIIACKQKPQKPIAVKPPPPDSTLVHKLPILILDAGHGAIDPGAVNDSLKLYEKNLTRAIVDATIKHIDTTKITVIQTRPNDTNIHRHQRIIYANQFSPNLLLTVHINNSADTTYNGFEMSYADSLVTYMDDYDTISIANPNRDTAAVIANVFEKQVAKQFPAMRWRPIKKRKDRIWMICAGRYPSIMLEFGFLNNRKDLKYLTDKKEIEKLGAALHKAIEQALL